MNSNVPAVRTVRPAASTEIISSPVQCTVKIWFTIVWNNKLCSFWFSDDRRKLLVRWTISLQKVVQSSALYCAARLLVGGNYWNAGNSVFGKLFNHQPCTVLLDCWSAKLMVRCTLSLRRVLIKGPARAKNPLTVLFQQTLQQTVLYLWSITEAWYQSARLFESSTPHKWSTG